MVKSKDRRNNVSRTKIRDKINPIIGSIVENIVDDAVVKFVDNAKSAENKIANAQSDQVLCNDPSSKINIKKLISDISDTGDGD